MNEEKRERRREEERRRKDRRKEGRKAAGREGITTTKNSYKSRIHTVIAR